MKRDYKEEDDDDKSTLSKQCCRLTSMLSHYQRPHLQDDVRLKARLQAAGGRRVSELILGDAMIRLD